MTKGMELPLALELACSIEIDNTLLRVVSYDEAEECLYCIDAETLDDYHFGLQVLKDSKSLRVFSMEEMKII